MHSLHTLCVNAVTIYRHNLQWSPYISVSVCKLLPIAVLHRLLSTRSRETQGGENLIIRNRILDKGTVEEKLARFAICYQSMSRRYFDICITKYRTTKTENELCTARKKSTDRGKACRMSRRNLHLSALFRFSNWRLCS